MILTGRARLAGVMGWPVGHSRSPRLHGYWLERYGIDGAYVPLAVPPERFAEALRALPALGFAGANVTVPHKEAALAAVDAVEPEAHRIGAVNTIVVGPDGRLTGGNTDAFGFMAHLRATAPGWQAKAGPAAMIGAGGAARAVAYALAKAGVPEIRLVNRTATRAEALATALAGPFTVRAWADRAAALRDAVLLVNTTTQGMTGQPVLDLAPEGLASGAVVYDLVYVPLATPLIRAAQAKGLATVDGLGMLLHQARPGFKAWFGVDPEVDEGLRAFVAQGL